MSTSLLSFLQEAFPAPKDQVSHHRGRRPLLAFHNTVVIRELVMQSGFLAVLRSGCLSGDGGLCFPGSPVPRAMPALCGCRLGPAEPGRGQP